MKIYKSLPGVYIMTVSAIFICPTSNAQSPVSRSNTTSTASANTTDTTFIAKNIRDNILGIELSQLGISRGINPVIKQAAQQMVADHSQMLDDLRRMGTKNNMPGITGNSTGTTGMSNSGTVNIGAIKGKTGSDTLDIRTSADGKTVTVAGSNRMNSATAVKANTGSGTVILGTTSTGTTITGVPVAGTVKGNIVTDTMVIGTTESGKKLREQR